MIIVIGKGAGNQISSAEAYRTYCIREMLDSHYVYLSYELSAPILGKFLFLFEALVLKVKILWFLNRYREITVISQVNIVTLLGLVSLVHFLRVTVVFDFCERLDNYKYRSGVGSLYRFKGRIAELLFNSVVSKVKFLCISTHLISCLPKCSSHMFLPILYNDENPSMNQEWIFDKHAKDDILKVVFSGTIDFSKDGSDLLVLAFIDLLFNLGAKEQNIELHILGDGKDLVSLMEMVPSGLCESSVFFHGRIPQKRVKNILKSAHISVLPRLFSLQAEGGFPTKLVDYWSMGTALIIHPVGEVSNYLEDCNNSLVLHELTKASLYSALLKLVNDAQLRLRLSKEGMKSVLDCFEISKHRNQLNEFLTKND